MDAVQVNDENRTARLFVGFLANAFGSDQSLANADYSAINQPRQYQALGPGGLVGVEGTSRSNAQGIATFGNTLPPLLIAGALVAVYLILRK